MCVYLSLIQTYRKKNVWYGGRSGVKETLTHLLKSNLVNRNREKKKIEQKVPTITKPSKYIHISKTVLISLQMAKIKGKYRRWKRTRNQHDVSNTHNVYVYTYIYIYIIFQYQWQMTTMPKHLRLSHLICGMLFSLYYFCQFSAFAI